MSKKYLELFLYTHKINTKSLIDILPILSSKTTTYLLKDLTKQYDLTKNDNDVQETSRLDGGPGTYPPFEIDSLNQGLPMNTLPTYAKGTLYIFSDGNVKSNGKKNSKGGYSVYFGETLPFSQFNTTIINNNQPTNNKMELSGILYIFKVLSENPEIFLNINIVIVTDSLYSINCITKWADNWIKNDWVNSKKEPVKNKELIQKILNLHYNTRDIEISFKHVYSHTKEPYNKDSLEWMMWYGNNIVDTNINKMLDNNL